MICGMQPEIIVGQQNPTNDGAVGNAKTATRLTILKQLAYSKYFVLILQVVLPSLGHLHMEPQPRKQRGFSPVHLIDLHLTKQSI
jgi:hypothetical protein